MSYSELLLKYFQDKQGWYHNNQSSNLNWKVSHQHQDTSALYPYPLSSLEKDHLYKPVDQTYQKSIHNVHGEYFYAAVLLSFLKEI